MNNTPRSGGLYRLDIPVLSRSRTRTSLGEITVFTDTEAMGLLNGSVAMSLYRDVENSLVFLFEDKTIRWYMSKDDPDDWIDFWVLCGDPMSPEQSLGPRAT